jgi:hypothetical protein
MTFHPAALDLVKLALGLGAFVFIALVGARSKRIAGVLLTFPILNGIAMLSSAEPFRVADAIALLVIFNAALFWLAVTCIERLPPMPLGMPEPFVLIARLLLWIATWCAGAYWLTDHRDAFPSGAALFVIALGLALASVACLWRPPPPSVAGPDTAAARQVLAAWTIRLLLFVGVFCVLLATAQNASDQKWVGMASSLPLPGLFALAHLSTVNDKDQLRPIRDTLLLGPLLVIPFNGLFAGLVTRLPPGSRGTTLGIMALLAAWAVALAVVFWLIPRGARYLDALRRLGARGR